MAIEHDDQKPYEFIWFWWRSLVHTYESIGFSAIEGHDTYGFVRFLAIQGHDTYEFIGFSAIRATMTMNL